MTTSSANNSVFRGFFEKQKLTGPNFIDWYRQLRIVLSIDDKLNYLEQPLPPAPVAPAGQHVAPEILAAHTAWVKGSKEIAGLMLMTMEPEIQRNLENLHANDMLKELKALFAQQAEQELLQTTRDFHACKQEEGQSVSSYVLRMKGYIDNLERLGHPVTLGLAVSLILIGLRKEFDGFVQNYNMHSLGKTVNELHAMLKLHEQTLNLPKNNAPALHAIRAGKVQKGKKHNKPQPSKAGRGQNQGNGKHKHAYAPKPKIPPPPKREDPAKDSICHECGIFVIELNTFLNRSWIYDTGCATHICNTTQSLRASRKLKPGALSFVIPRDGIFEIDLSNSYANENSIYTVSNKRAKLDCDSASCVAIVVLDTQPRNALKRVEKTTYESRLWASPKLSYLKSLGVVEALVKRDTLTKPDKLEPRSIKCIFIGYPKETMDILSTTHTRSKVLVAQNAGFLENSLIDQEASPQGYAVDRMCLYIDAEEHELGDLDIRAIRILIAIAAYYDYEVWQMDVKNVFLNGYLNEEVYMEQLEGFVNPKYPNRKFGFTQNRDEPCVYLKASGSNVTFLILYVDDILIMGNSIPMLQDVKSYLGRCFAMKDLGEAAYILGIKIYRDRSRWLIGLCQSAYIEKILKRFHMENSKRGSIPMQEKLRLSKSQGASTPAELKRMQNVPYASAVGSIMYVVRCTRPDVAFAQNITSRFQQNPGDLHWTTVKNILKVSCYTDAGYLTDADDLKSQTGYVFVLNGGAVDWKSAKQSIFATSSAEAEYIAAYDASKEAVWVRKFISGLGVVPTIEKPINMYCDNTGAIAIAKESRITKGARHFRAKVHYLREVIEFGDIKLEKVHTDDNLADPFTKALAFPKHSEHTRNIGMLPASSLMQICVY
ncbi:retrotransposon protein, putative, ty1-copia subclass [Tanacetum coccineum]|uniref:Retrotransposon protein, putative, ty1-copia subclass n=1 Tax=Tanacetum coccineum TaxID=301880 RepID=A0ABQ4Z070_9ASTR